MTSLYIFILIAVLVSVFSMVGVLELIYVYLFSKDGMLDSQNESPAENDSEAPNSDDLPLT